MNQERYRLYGVLGSPYAAKLRALFRYRHISFDWKPAGFDWAPSFYKTPEELKNAHPQIIPIVWFPADGSLRTDSTIIAGQLEKLHRNGRSVLPDHPAIRFLSNLLDDFGDEWALKIAFQYRWGNEDDRNFTNRLIMAELLGGGVSQDVIIGAAGEFRDRQISRMPLVGCIPDNQKLIEKSYFAILDAISSVRANSSFLFGSRPCLGDFGLFGALFTCRNDPSAGSIMRKRSPATLDWIHVLDEASGVEGSWVEPDGISNGTKALVQLVAQVYLPFLLANHAAIERGDAEVSFQAFGLPFKQAPFRYQAKCLKWLREEYAGLEDRDRSWVDSLFTNPKIVRAFADDN